MNTQRIIVLSIAAVAAIGAALIVRGLVGGGTPKVVAAPAPPPVAMTEVLVASQALQPGDAINPSRVRWQSWPAQSVDSSLVTRKAMPDLAAGLNNAVARVPMVPGEPVTPRKYVRAGNGASFMSASLAPGMRAVSIPLSIASVAGGFIQPNDRVDIVLSEKISDNPMLVRARTILEAVRVLAIDQVSEAAGDKKPVADVKTATLEVTPADAELVSRAQLQGTLSLSLRPLMPEAETAQAGTRAPGADPLGGSSGAPGVTVFRYGVPSTTSGGR